MENLQLIDMKVLGCIVRECPHNGWVTCYAPYPFGQTHIKVWMRGVTHDGLVAGYREEGPMRLYTPVAAEDLTA